MARKQRVDSATAAVEIMQAAVIELRPPDHVPIAEADEPFWRSIIAEKPKSEWTGHDLEIAALLASSLRKLRDEEATLETEGSVLTTAGGNAAANPRLRIVADLHARAMKYRQTLGIHNRGKNGEQRDVEKRREAAKIYEDATVDTEALFASPTVQ